MFDGQRNHRQLKNIMGLHLKPRSDYGKITENGISSGILFCPLSSRRNRKESAMQGGYRFRNPIPVFLRHRCGKGLF